MFAPFATGIDTALDKFVHFGSQFVDVMSFSSSIATFRIPLWLAVSHVINPHIVDLQPQVVTINVTII
jgi:hypothetical protein